MTGSFIGGGRRPEGTLAIEAAGALLVTADFGPDPELFFVNRAQYMARYFLIKLATYGFTAGADPKKPLPIHDPLAINTFRERIAMMIQQDLELDVFTKRVIAQSENIDIDIRPGLRLTSSVTVNPWQDVITVGHTMGASLAYAGWQALKHANQILDFFLRLYTIGIEREARISNLRLKAVQADVEIVVQIIDSLERREGDSPLVSIAAAELLSTALSLDNRILQAVSAREITLEESDQRRRQVRAIVGSESDQVGRDDA
ncbi:hypothetical protein F5X71_29575 [Nocardia brasiliensis]|uniref:Uncharacterized protein n=1 Tax=Nocardia brasiliensis TaxID=37326 RepID=A0A6G9XY89_NOCBR|nr:hypothetical protein [Nocardia brasiliensis]QIS05905.1 hypothetical protein F5X71_29575 [Nocardia brasiliensis]